MSQLKLFCTAVPAALKEQLAEGEELIASWQERHPGSGGVASP